MKFLILRFSSIGDIVLTTPVVRCLRKKFPDAEIHYATKASFKDIVALNPNITKIHLLHDSIFKLASELKKEKFTHVIDLHNNQRTLLLKALLGIKHYSFNKLNFEKWLMVTFKINKLPQLHIVDRYLATCKELGVENDHEGLDYFLAEEDEKILRDLPESFLNGYIALVIGGQQKTKQLPNHKVIEVLSKVSSPVVILGGEGDKNRADEIVRSVNKQHNIFNACGKYSLNQSAALVKNARTVITNDTGLMHIGSAFKRTIVSLWGNTIPEFGMSPYKTPSHTIQVSGLSCRPCSKLGYNSCPKGHFKCMNMIDTTEITNIVLRKND